MFCLFFFFSFLAHSTTVLLQFCFNFQEHVILQKLFGNPWWFKDFSILFWHSNIFFSLSSRKFSKNSLLIVPLHSLPNIIIDLVFIFKNGLSFQATFRYKVISSCGLYWLTWLGLPRWHSGKESALLQKQERKIWSLGLEDPFEKEMVTYSNILAWKIPWTEDPGRLQFMGSWRTGHNWAHTHTCAWDMEILKCDTFWSLIV